MKKQLTPKQQKRFDRLAKLVSDSPLAVFEYLAEIEDRLDNELPATIGILEKIKGDKGDDAVVDYEYIINEVKKLIPTPRDGEDGKTPEIDYKKLTNDVLARIPKPKDGEDATVDYTFIIKEVSRLIPKPKDGDNGSPDTAEDIRNKLELLRGEERLDARYIKGLDMLSRLPDIERMAQINAVPVTTSFFNGLRGKNMNIIGATASQNGDTINITVPNSGGGGVGAWQTPPESPASDGSVTVFTVGSSAPTDVNADGTIYPSGTAWTFLAGQITLNIGGAGPTQFIRYR